MADRYSVPSPGEAFARSFTSTFTPFLTEAITSRQKDVDRMTNSFITNWMKAKEDWAQVQTDNAELKQTAKAIASEFGGSANYTVDQLEGFVLAKLIRYDGDAKAVEQLVGDAIYQGALVTNQDITKEIAKDLNAVATNDPSVMPDSKGGTNPDSVALSFAINNKTMANRPDAISGMNPKFIDKLNDLYLALPEDIRDKIQIYSGFRSAQHQAEILAWNMTSGKYDDFFNDNDRIRWLKDVEELGPEEAGKLWEKQFTDSGLRAMVALPGKSMHQHGNAADLKYNGLRLDKAPAEIVEAIHGAAKGVGLHFPLPNEKWQVELMGTRSEGYVNPKLAQETTSILGENISAQTEYGRTLGTKYSLPTLLDLTGGDETLSEQIASNAKLIFGQDRSHYVKQSIKDFQKYLTDTGELSLYESFLNGEMSMEPISSISTLKIDQKALREDKIALPNLFQIEDYEGWQNAKAILDAIPEGSMNKPSAEWLAGFNALETKLKATGQFGLPRNFSDLSNRFQIEKAVGILNGLSEEEKNKLPANYIKRLLKIEQTTRPDEDNKVTMESLASDLLALKAHTAEMIKLHHPDGLPVNPDDYHQDVKEALAAEKEFSANDIPTAVSIMEQLNVLDPTAPLDQKLPSLLAQRKQLKDFLKTIELRDNGITTVYVRDQDMFDQSTAKLTEVETQIQTLLISKALSDGDSFNTETVAVLNLDTDGNPDGSVSEVEVFVTRDLDGNPVRKPYNGGVLNQSSIVPMTTQMIDDRNKIISELSIPEREYNTKVKALQNSVGLAYELIQLVDQDPLIIQAPTTMGAFAVAKRLNNEVTATLDLLQRLTQNGASVQTSGDGANAEVVNQLERVENEINALEMRGVTDTLTRFKILQAKQILLTFRIGGLEDQKGMAMSNKDFDRLQRALNTTNVAAFKRNMFDYFSNAMSIVNTVGTQLRNNPKINIWESKAKGTYTKPDGTTVDYKLDFFNNTGGFVTLDDLYESGMTNTQKLGYDYFRGPGPEDVVSESSPAPAEYMYVLDPDTNSHVRLTLDPEASIPDSPVYRYPNGQIFVPSQ